jgi:hypothetical protein
MTCLFVCSSSFLVFAVSVIHMMTVMVSYYVEYILHVTCSLLELSPYTVSSAKCELRLIHIYYAVPMVRPCRSSTMSCR